MIQITEIKEMQDMLKHLMKDVHDICEKHGLTYNLYGGSLLGAVRHCDIIPWDDDIDITMPRPDYEKLKVIINTEYCDKFDLYDFPKDNYIYPYMKICKKGTVLFEDDLRSKYSKLGLYIDIFPMDGIRETNDAELIKRFANSEKNKKYTSFCVGRISSSPVWWKKPFVIVKFLRCVSMNVLGYKHFVKKQIKETTKYSYESCDFIGFVSFGDCGRRAIIEKKTYLNRKLYKFGEYEFWGVTESDMLLKKLYGDYMIPPPKDKRVPCHNYRLYIDTEDGE